MLHCDAATLTNGLTTRRIKAGNEWVTSPITADVAQNVSEPRRRNLLSPRPWPRASPRASLRASPRAAPRASPQPWPDVSPSQ